VARKEKDVVRKGKEAGSRILIPWRIKNRNSIPPFKASV
jgi:hypothetical protein